MITYQYTCGGCFAKESVDAYRETMPMFKSVEQFRLEGGFCTYNLPTAIDKLPEGWGICLLGCTYCKSCFEKVNHVDSLPDCDFCGNRSHECDCDDESETEANPEGSVDADKDASND